MSFNARVSYTANGSQIRLLSHLVLLIAHT